MAEERHDPDERRPRPALSVGAGTTRRFVWICTGSGGSGYLPGESCEGFRNGFGPSEAYTAAMAEISGIAPLFIVTNVPASLAFYRDRLGFAVTFEGPDPGDIFFGIVQRDGAMIMFKDVGIEPTPNSTRDVGQGLARWDAYVHVPDPDALAAEFRSRNVEFAEPLQDTHDGLRGFELRDADGYILFFGRPRH